MSKRRLVVMASIVLGGSIVLGTVAAFFGGIGDWAYLVGAVLGVVAFEVAK